MVGEFKLKIKWDKQFEKSYKKKDNSVQKKVQTQIEKIIEDPTIGKPMRNTRKGTRERRIPPFRLSYRFYRSDDEEDKGKNIYKLIFLDLYHKDNQ